MLAFIGGLVMGVGAVLIGIGLFWRKFAPVAGVVVGGDDDRAFSLELENQHLKARLAKAEKQVKELQEQVAVNAASPREAKIGLELVKLRGIIQEKDREIASLRNWIEKELQTPARAVLVKPEDRPAIIRELYAEGWSKRKIMRHVRGYICSSALAEVNAALQGCGTSIVKV